MRYLRSKLLLSFALALGFVSGFMTGCETIKPYEKEYLLDPLMDDGTVARMKSDMQTSSSARNERLAAGAGATGGGSSCPTCGG